MQLFLEMGTNFSLSIAAHNVHDIQPTAHIWGGLMGLNSARTFAHLPL